MLKSMLQLRGSSLGFSSQVLVRENVGRLRLALFFSASDHHYQRCGRSLWDTIRNSKQSSASSHVGISNLCASDGRNVSFGLAHISIVCASPAWLQTIPELSMPIAVPGMPQATLRLPSHLQLRKAHRSMMKASKASNTYKSKQVREVDRL